MVHFEGRVRGGGGAAGSLGLADRIHKIDKGLPFDMDEYRIDKDLPFDMDE